MANKLAPTGLRQALTYVPVDHDPFVGEPLKQAAGAIASALPYVWGHNTKRLYDLAEKAAPKTLNSFRNLFTAPHDALYGSLDPSTPEGFARVQDAAYNMIGGPGGGLVGAGLKTATKGALKAGKEVPPSHTGLWAKAKQAVGDSLEHGKLGALNWLIHNPREALGALGQEKLGEMKSYAGLPGEALFGKGFDYNNPEDFAKAQGLAGLAMTGPVGAPAGALAHGYNVAPKFDKLGPAVKPDWAHDMAQKLMDQHGSLEKAAKKLDDMHWDGLIDPEEHAAINHALGNILDPEVAFGHLQESPLQAHINKTPSGVGHGGDWILEHPKTKELQIANTEDNDQHLASVLYHQAGGDVKAAKELLDAHHLTPDEAKGTLAYLNEPDKLSKVVPLSAKDAEHINAIPEEHEKLAYQTKWNEKTGESPYFSAVQAAQTHGMDNPYDFAEKYLNLTNGGKFEMPAPKGWASTGTPGQEAPKVYAQPKTIDIPGNLKPLDWVNYKPSENLPWGTEHAPRMEYIQDPETRARAMAMGNNPNVLLLSGMSRPWRGNQILDPALHAADAYEPAFFMAHDPDVSHTYTGSGSSWQDWEKRLVTPENDLQWHPALQPHPGEFGDTYHLPIIAQGKNALQIDWREAGLSPLGYKTGEHGMSGIISHAKKQGADLVVVRNVADVKKSGHGPQDQYLLLSNKGHRLPWAQFDPRYADSPDLLRSGGGPAGLAGSLTFVPVDHDPFGEQQNGR
jgi:hypothetical protein